LVTVDAGITAFDYRPTRQTARPLHANTQGKEGTSQETLTDVESTDGMDNEDAVPEDAHQTLRIIPHKQTILDETQAQIKDKIGKKRWNMAGTDKE